MPSAAQCTMQPGKGRMVNRSVVWVQYKNVTDRQTDTSPQQTRIPHSMRPMAKKSTQQKVTCNLQSGREADGLKVHIVTPIVQVSIQKLSNNNKRFHMTTNLQAHCRMSQHWLITPSNTGRSRVGRRPTGVAHSKIARKRAYYCILCYSLWLAPVD